MGYHKLHYRTEFQGLPVSVENRKGSKRYWYDPNSGEEGSTKMLHPYGYVRGTMGIDGDEVDVYLGPDKESEKVFIITQLKKPEFKKVDEQKVMLGFKSAKEAKAAYLKHYNSPKFFKDMKEMSMEEFKGKLSAQKGKLIKGELYISPDSDKISDIVVEKSKKKAPLGEGSRFKELSSKVKKQGAKDPDAVAAAIGRKKYGKKKFQKLAAAGKAAIDEEDLDLKKDVPDSAEEKISKRFKSDAQRKYMYAAADRGEISRDVVEEFQSKTPKGADLPEKVKKDKSVKKSYISEMEDAIKALTSVMASSISRRARMAERVEQHNALAAVSTEIVTNEIATHDDGMPVVADVAQDRPVIGTTRERPSAEPPVVPVRMIHNGPLAITPCEAEVFKSCDVCGTMRKSTAPCRRCEQLEAMKGSGTAWSA